SCHASTWQGLPRWVNAWKKPEIVLKVYNPAALAELPAGTAGRGRLRAHPGDLEAAERLVDSILRSPVPARAAPHQGPIRPGLTRPPDATHGPGRGPAADGGRRRPV